MGSLYHYCTAETLKAILKNRTLRLSDIRKSNDSKEIDFLFDKYNEWNLKKHNYSSNSHHNVNVMRTDLKIQMENTVFLVSCLSKKADDLHMWSCYGNKGVCIGLDEQLLKDSIDKIRYGCSLEVYKRNYTHIDKALSLEEVKYFSYKDACKYFENNNLNGYDDFAKIFDNSPKIKNKFFKLEKEVRIIYKHINSLDTVNHLSLVDNNNRIIRPIIDDDKITNSIKLESISTDNYQHKMIVDIPIDINVIKSITIGPNSTLSEQDIKELLFINEIGEISIKKSKGSYR